MGRRSRPNQKRASWRVGEETPERLSDIALMLGFVHGNGGAVGKMLDAIASGEYLIIPKTTQPKTILKKKK